MAPWEFFSGLLGRVSSGKVETGEPERRGPLLHNVEEPT
jgi:hypothetical protein